MKKIFNDFTFTALLTALLLAVLPGVTDAISEIPIPQPLEDPLAGSNLAAEISVPKIIFEQGVPQQELITVASLEEWVSIKQVIPQQQNISVASLEQQVVSGRPAQSATDLSGQRYLVLVEQHQTEYQTGQTTVSNYDMAQKPIRTLLHDSPAVTMNPDTEFISQSQALIPTDSFQPNADISSATKVKIEINPEKKQLDMSIAEPVQQRPKTNFSIRDGHVNDRRGEELPVEHTMLTNTPAEINVKPMTEISMAQQLGLGIKRIVIDPGHGGRDPGAGGFGLLEKDIVLKVAMMAGKILEEQYKYEVVLTREDDSFLSLEKRTTIANTQKADLFLSIHVNAHPESSVKGVESFYLNFTNNKDAIRVAALENASSNHNINELRGILTELMLNANTLESSMLAELIQNSMVRGLHEEEYFVRNLGVKQAPFFVLVGAKMPAVLVEISYISNFEEAQRLKDDNYLQTIAEQISAGVKVYAEMRKTIALQ